MADANLPRDRLNAFIEERQLGMCFPDNTGFHLPGLGDTAKVHDYLTAGTRLLWIIDPSLRSASIRVPSSDAHLVPEGASLDGGMVLPGFVMPLDRLFARLARAVT